MTDQEIEILLVEDNPKDVELTMHALKKNNLANNVRVARDGQEAIDLLFANGAKPRLVLLDLKLPRLTGLEVLAMMRADEATKFIPVVVLTSSNREADVEECYRLGVNSYLQKPVDFNEFISVAKTLGLYWLLMNRAPRGPA